MSHRSSYSNINDPNKTVFSAGDAYNGLNGFNLRGNSGIDSLKENSKAEVIR